MTSKRSAGASSATPAGGARPRSDHDLTPLVGHLPGEAEFAAEFPGGELMGAMLARAAERLGAAVESRVAAVWRVHGLSHGAGNALAVIEGSDGPMTPGEISAAMHITSGSITSLLDTLEKQGLVARTAHPEDRRKVMVDLTPQGQALLDEALPSVVLVVTQLSQGLKAADRAKLLHLMDEMYSAIGELDDAEIPVGTRHRPGRATD